MVFEGLPFGVKWKFDKKLWMQALSIALLDFSQNTFVNESSNMAVKKASEQW